MRRWVDACGRNRDLSILVVFGLLGSISGQIAARAGDEFSDEPRSGLHRLFHRASPPATVAAGSVPQTAGEIAQRIDHVAESIRNDGLVVLKQPDVFSQARMTKYRREFEEIMAKEKDNFKVILAGRVARLDQASLDSQTSLSAALTPPGSTVKVTAPTTATPPVAPALDGTADAPRFLDKTLLGQDNLNLGLEPNSVLDEQKSYLDRLHQIRRVNLGNDIADSAGYGLYLIRMPVSITPGECTLMGHGAEATVTIKHEFPPNFLASTFRNLVINDLVDQLAPPIYEVVRVRVGFEQDAQKLEDSVADLKRRGGKQLDDLAKSILNQGKVPQVGSLHKAAEQKPDGNVPIPPPNFVDFRIPANERSFENLVTQLARYVARLKIPYNFEGSPTNEEAEDAVARRVFLLTSETGRVLDEWIARKELLPHQREAYQQIRKELDEWIASVTQPVRNDLSGRRTTVLDESDQNKIQSYLELILQDFFYIKISSTRERFIQVIRELYSSSFPDDVNLINEAFELDRIGGTDTAVQAAKVNLELARVRSQIRANSAKFKAVRLPSDRAAKRSYPISPGELDDFFLESNLDLLARDIQRKRPTQTARASDIRSYLRQQLSVAYDVMSRPSSKVDTAIAPLDDQAAMDQILRLIHDRAFTPDDGGELALTLFDYYRQWIAKLPSNLEGRPLGALCWTIAVDAALLDEALREQAKVTFQANSLPCPDLDSLRFYAIQPDLAAQAAGVFNDYVANRWPVITFALDPVVDQQNILDNFSLRRDLQLALGFAFSTGQIGFNQLTTFRRKIQQDEETVALNKTVTSFAHGNETFGWRFTPRLQTPPSQGNLATLGSTLLRGGTGPNYGLRKSKIEAGQRELVAVVIMPSFLPTIRVESSGNWFRLDDPEHLEVRTKRMLEQGRRVQELRAEFSSACDTACYRPADIRHLRTKIDQIDAMLPIQSKVVALPYDNAPAGFDLFTEGTTALVPELSGFEGVETVIQGQQADLLIFGKFISIHETRVVAGGRELKNTAGDDAGYEILSREVIRVHLPGDVQPSATRDNKAFVEIYLATPTGSPIGSSSPTSRGRPPTRSPTIREIPTGR